MIAAPALAQPPAGSRGVLLLPGGQYGSPLRTSGVLAVYVPTKVEGGFRSRGWIADGGVGQAGARASFGRAAVLEYLETDLRGVVYRTWGTPRGASTRSTYIGAEAGMSIAYARFTAGIARRISGARRASGASGDGATIVTWGVGVQVPRWLGGAATGGRRTPARRGA